MSSNGEPGGNSNGKGFDLVVTVVVVEIFTTDGINLSAKSANDAGISANEFLTNPKLKHINKQCFNTIFFINF